MYYAIYRECVIAVMPTKNELNEFCLLNYPAIIPYLTVLKM